MTPYIGTKIIKAKPMNRKEYYDLWGWEIDPADAKYEGYLVEYEDSESNHPDFEGYISWSPKDVFEKAYKRNGSLNFGHVVELLKMGESVTRDGVHLTLIDGEIYQLTPWVASQTDILSEDWQVV